VKVIVLGSGVIGVTSAYYLARAGHQVTVIDRQPKPALETSFANAGEVSPGYSSPWAGPGVPVKAVKWLLMKHGPLVIRPKLDPVMWIWVLKMLRNCTSARYAVNKSRMIPIAEYSRDCLRALRSETGIRYDERERSRDPVGETEAQIQPRRGVRRKADPGGMAQRHQAAVADQEIQARREDRRDENLAAEVDVEVSADQRKAGERQTQDDPCEPVHAPAALMC